MSGQSFITKMKCQVTSNKTHHVLISKEISWKSFKEICSGEPRKVNLAYNNVPFTLLVENNSTLLEKPDACYPLTTDMSWACVWENFPALTREWELLGMFFAFHNIEPNWSDGNGTWVGKDKETGIYEPSGLMGKV